MDTTNTENFPHLEVSCDHRIGSSKGPARPPGSALGHHLCKHRPSAKILAHTSCVCSDSVLPYSSWQSGCAVSGAPLREDGWSQSRCSCSETGPCCVWSSQTSTRMKKKKKPEITPEEKRLAQAQEQDQGNQGQCHSSDNLSEIWVQKILDFYKVSSSEPAGSMRKSYVYCVPLTRM